jgi:RNA 3'-terminal phosphate cyclase (ATP)
LRRIGAEVSVQLNRHGFYPAGGGEFIAQIQPAKLTAFDLPQRGERRQAYAEAIIAALPLHIARRELDVVRKRMGWQDDQLLLRGLSNDQGPGNALLLTLEHESVTEVFSGFAEKGVTAEAVAERTVEAMRRYLVSGAAVGPYLADQLLLPLALAGGGSFTASAISQHSLSNADVIQRFLPVAIRFDQTESEAWRVSVA